MATLRDIVCASGVNTLREYMCLPIGEGGGVVINSELVRVEVLPVIQVDVKDDITYVSLIPIQEVEVEDDIIYVTELMREVVDVVC